MPEPSTSRTRLIEQLSGVFVRNGYAGATLSQLAVVAGMSKSSLYHHFPGGKQEMAQALLRHAIADLEARAFAALHAPGPPAERLAGFLDGFSKYVDRGAGHCLLAVLAQAGPRTDLSQEIAAQVDVWLTRLTRTLEESGVKPKRARRFASDLLNQLYGSLTLGKMLGDAGHFDRTVRRAAKGLRKKR
jgi:TetR/AcrR family transcriptional repressor of lmrAB and yxaGH operons